MNNGTVNNNNKNNSYSVWPVRSGEWEATPRVIFPELYRSYYRCRRTKRSTLNALRFESHAETNLYILAEELAQGTYQPSRSIRFAVDRPKLREIVAADFRDRVVHHYLVERLERLYEPIFIHDSYACRIGKGVHAALQRVQDFMRSGTKNGAEPLYALHLDVKNFFTSIDKRILARIVEDRLVKEARRHSAIEGAVKGEMLSFLNALTKTILSHNPMDNRVDKGNRRVLAAVPQHKSLLHAPDGVGLPVGNLTSQFFANVYLNELDQYCKHTLKCRYYVRYCDDFLILDTDPGRLAKLRETIRQFLAEKLYLQLNTRYAAITDVRNGIDFIGYIIRPDYVLVRRRSINNLQMRLRAFERSCVQVTSSAPRLYTVARNATALVRLRGVVASYYGHFKWGDTHRLRHALFRRFPWLNALFRMDRYDMPRVTLYFKRISTVVS
jgi:retron-type reverse transcriptase